MGDEAVGHVMDDVVKLLMTVIHDETPSASDFDASLRLAVAAYDWRHDADLVASVAREARRKPVRDSPQVEARAAVSACYSMRNDERVGDEVVAALGRLRASLS
jgi:hypothetical protein